MKRRGIRVIATLGLTVAMIIVGLGTASAQASVKATDTNANRDYVIAYPLATSRSDSAVFYPTGSIDSSTVVILAEADGSLPGGFSETQLADIIATAKANPERTASGTITIGDSSGSRGYTTWYGGTGCNFGNAAVQQSPSILGANDSATVTYIWWLNNGRGANGSALGYYRGYNGSELGVWASWYGLGSTSINASANAYGRVPWGNVIGLAKFMVASTDCGSYAQGGFTT